MKARSRLLAENSLSSALSAIEIYNKPDFRHREQAFCILMIIAWESLFKAKILADNRNRLASIYARDGRRYRRNRTGHYLTIGLPEAMGRCAVPPVVTDNVLRLTEVRDAAVHLTAASKHLPYLAFTLGAATLRNYARLIRGWFGVGLSDYNFYILPLGFDYPFKALSRLEQSREPEDVKLILHAVAQSQAEDRSEDGDFSLVCEVRTTLVAAKKITDQTDLVAKIDPTSADAVFVSRDVSIIDRYPHTYREILRRLKEWDPSVTQQQLNHLIATRSIKSDVRYAKYHFMSKKHEARGSTPATPVVYCDAFLQLARTALCQEGLGLQVAGGNGVSR